MRPRPGPGLRTAGILVLGVVLAGALTRSDVRVPPGSDSRPASERVAARVTPSTPRADTASGVKGSMRTNAVRAARLARAAAVAGALEPDVRSLEASAAEVHRWLGCIGYVPVDEAGDRSHGFGYVYDEMDGTGPDVRLALRVHRSAGRPAWRVLTLSRARGCESALIGGAVDPPGARPPAGTALTRAAGVPSTRTLLRRAASLRRSVDRLTARAHLVDATFDRFDTWESCLVWLPTTELGDLDQDMGYEYRAGDAVSHVPAIGIDRTNRDDPDYQLLAFKGTAVPFTSSQIECDDEPGEAADRTAAATSAPAPGAPLVDRRIGRLTADLSALRAELSDARTLERDFHEFDQCMYTVGVSESGRDGGPTGYVYQAADGSRSLQSALALDMRGFTPSRWDVLAFPGEEPPQIECTEDAGGQDTDD